MPVAFGLAAALLWGISDVLARFSARGLGPLRSLYFGQLPGLALLTVWLLAVPSAHAEIWRAPPGAWGAALLASPLNLFASYALTRAVTVGTLALVMPLISSYGAVSALLAVASGEALGRGAALGLLATLCGAALAAAHRPARTADEPRRAGLRLPAGVPWALAAAMTFGLTVWMQGTLVVPRLGSVIPVWIYAATAIPLLSCGSRLLGQSLAPPPRRKLLLALGTGLLTACAYAAVSLGLSTGQVAIVSVLSSLSSAVSALLGFTVLGERLARWQWGGIGLIMAGVATINATLH
ncbi:MAG TPA: DMT family transporter [Acetobacteraceae bacterium]|nr:DMT family transporter [Acetobacteraceae bacterium]